MTCTYVCIPTCIYSALGPPAQIHEDDIDIDNPGSVVVDWIRPETFGAALSNYSVTYNMIKYVQHIFEVNLSAMYIQLIPYHLMWFQI